MSKYIASPIHHLLGPEFYDEVQPASFPEHKLRYRNHDWAQRVGLDSLSDREWCEHFGQFKPLPGNLPGPLALRYHGHQFRSYNPDLGDGRGFLFAQIRDPIDHRILDLGTKGSGQTPYSRAGDGRLTLKGAVREALATTWLEALEVNTSKTFSIIETGEQLERHDEPSPTRSAVLVRLSHSHIRFGSFQRLAYLNLTDSIKTLLKHSARFYYSDKIDLEDPELGVLFFDEVIAASAKLCAQWMIAGFVHGVLNTDNLVITGESFDYGPYRFLPHYDPLFTAAYFDHSSLYAYARQPEAVYWNLLQLAKALSYLDNDLDKYVDRIEQIFSDKLRQEMSRLFLRRLWLKPQHFLKAEVLLQSGYSFLQSSKISFDGFFFDWAGGIASKEEALNGPRGFFYQGSDFEKWLKTLEAFEAENLNSLQQIRRSWISPPSLLIDEVENIWSDIAEDDDWSRFSSKLEEFKKWPWYKNR